LFYIIAIDPKYLYFKGDNILARAKSELGVRCLEDILAPASESGRRSVEEMQKSLSTESSPSSSRVIYNILIRIIYFKLKDFEYLEKNNFLSIN
jgi:hypothetical protein